MTQGAPDPDLPMRLLVRGYHGTSGVNAERILTTGFDPAIPSLGRFGCGCYFFEENEERAWNWAGLHGGGDPAVLVAQLDLSDNGLDLTQRAGREALLEFLATFEDLIALQRENGALADSDGYVDAVAIELMAQSFDIHWVRVLVFDTARAYSEEAYGAQQVSLPESLRTAGARSRVVRNVQTHVVVRDRAVIFAVRKLTAADKERSR